MNSIATGTGSNTGTGGLLGRYLTRPGNPLTQLAGLLHGLMGGGGWWAAAIAVALATATVLARQAFHRRAQAKLTAGGHTLVVWSPPTVDAASAAALWAHLVGLCAHGGGGASASSRTSPSSTPSPLLDSRCGCGHRRRFRPRCCAGPSKPPGPAPIPPRPRNPRGLGQAAGHGDGR
ncbi:hypothetical protein ACFQZC_08490 [Streptacidiphilus monticola]